MPAQVAASDLPVPAPVHALLAAAPTVPAHVLGQGAREEATALAHDKRAAALSFISSHSSWGSESTVMAPPAPTLTPLSAHALSL